MNGIELKIIEINATAKLEKPGHKIENRNRETRAQTTGQMKATTINRTEFMLKKLRGREHRRWS